MINKIDFKTYKFRCSGLANLMVSSRSKTDPLSETTKAYLREVFIREVYQREKFDTTNKYTEKGIMCEPDSMDLIKKVKKQTYFKNNQHFENEYIQGTPDIVLMDAEKSSYVKDVKTSWSIFTFANVTEESALKSYYYQLLGYMSLTGAKTSELIYCLVNTPEEIMNDELYKLSFKYPEMNESDEKMQRFKRNYIFDDIPAKQRIKSFAIEYNEDDYAELIQKIILSRAYLQTLSL